MFIKVNEIKFLQSLKSIFYIFNIVILSLIFYLGIVNFLLPKIPVDGMKMIIGSNESSFINYIISNVEIRTGNLAAYIFLVLFICLNIIINCSIQFAFKFNFKKNPLISWISLCASLLLFIILTVIIFNTKDLNGLDLNSLTNNTKNIGTIFSVSNQANNIKFSYSIQGIFCIIFYAILITTFVVTNIFLTNRIVKLKYI